ncbi:MAG: pilus assembly PilX N-terminal domain-containing protein [Syntrophales bacterium]|nr:pilus assembly PilX N-terminal domain-containing protein [Syntrophales bacterium]
MQHAKRYPGESLRDEKGLSIVVGLLTIAALMLLGTTAVMVSTTNVKISANYKTANQAFFAAEAGIEEARARMGENFTPTTGATGRIDDSSPTSAAWSVSIGGPGPYTSIQSALSYTVRIVHKTDTAGNILYWGDSNGDGFNDRNTTTGENIYLVTSYGAASGASKTIEVEMAINRIPVPGALYVKASTTIQGTSTHIIGSDSCGGASKPGITTTLATTTVSMSGNPIIKGSTSPTGTPPSIVSNPGANIDVQAMIDSFKGGADYQYNVASATHTGMNWGTPTPGATQDDPSSCSEKNIVYYNTSNGTNLTDITLSGGSMGCGILLVEGDLDASGDFAWNGVVIVSGSVRITGGGNKNITGGIIAGGSADADLIGGNISVVYCSSAVNNQTANQPLRNLSWMEKT